MRNPDKLRRVGAPVRAPLSRPPRAGRRIAASHRISTPDAHAGHRTALRPPRPARHRRRTAGRRDGRPPPGTPAGPGPWSPADRGHDALETILAQNRGRDPDLLALRHGRMAVSPWNYYRGAAAVMAADLGVAAPQRARGAALR